MEIVASEEAMKILRPEQVSNDTVFKYDCTPEELAEVYRLAREDFTAADLQKYTEPLDGGVPAADVLREMEEQQAEFDAQRQKK
jgi:hypothetical protein